MLYYTAFSSLSIALKVPQPRILVTGCLATSSLYSNCTGQPWASPTTTPIIPFNQIQVFSIMKSSPSRNAFWIMNPSYHTINRKKSFPGRLRLYYTAFSFLSIAFLTRAVIVTIMIGYALQLFAHILPEALCRFSVFGYIFNSLHVRELLQVLKKVKKGCRNK